MHVEQKWTRTFGRFKGGGKRYIKRCASKGKRQLKKKDIKERVTA